MEDGEEMKIHWLTDRFAISGALAADDIPRLKAIGFRSVIDLRGDGEPRPRGVAPWDEAMLARDAGLSYRQIAVEPPLLTTAVGHAVQRAAYDAPAPVLLHCTTGRRAATFGLILLACEDELTIDDCLARGRAMGVDFDGMPRLTVFLRDFVERYGKRYRVAENPLAEPGPAGAALIARAR
jgi:uncharacterized protein (TIGR01244 family)